MTPPEGVARWPCPTCNTPSSLLWSPCCREVMLREDLRLSLPERPCCRKVVLREDRRLNLPKRPCCREVVLREGLRLSLPERPCCREANVGVKNRTTLLKTFQTPGRVARQGGASSMLGGQLPLTLEGAYATPLELEAQH